MKRFLKKAGHFLLRSVPLVGEIVENVRSKDAGTGRLDWEKILTLVIRLVTLVIALVLFLKGDISLVQLEELLP